MLNESAKLVVADLTLKAAERTAGDLRAKGGEVLAPGTDVTHPDRVKEMAEKTIDRFGRIDVLVNNAAMLERVRVTRVPFYELDLNKWDRVMTVNVKGTFLCSRAVFPHMKTQGDCSLFASVTS